MTERRNLLFNRRETRIIAMAKESASKGKRAFKIRLREGVEPFDIKKIAQELHEEGINISNSYGKDSEGNIVFKPRRYDDIPETETREPEVSAKDVPLDGLYSDFFDDLFGNR